MLTNTSNRSVTSNKNFYISLCLQRFVLPVFITISVVIRPCFLSLIYLMYLLYLPFVPIVSRTNYKGKVLKYFTSLIAISFLTTLLQICFQIVLLSLSHDDLKSFADSTLEHCLFHFGLVRISKIPLTSLLHWIAPEFLMLAASVLVGVLLKRMAMLVPVVSAATATSTAASAVAALATAAASDRAEQINVTGETTAASLNADNYLTDEEGLMRNARTLTISKVYSNKFFVSLGLYITLLMFCLAGIIRPSIFGAIYFLTFLSAITYWATCRQLNRKFAVFMRLVLVILLGHILVLYVSQLKLVQDQLEPLDPNYYLNRLCRYFGIIRFVSFDRFEPRDISFVSYQWDNYVYPIFLLVLYFAIIIESRMILSFQEDRNSKQVNKLGKFARTSLTRNVSSRLASRNKGPTQKRRWQSATRKVRVAYDDVLPVTLSEQTPLIRGVSTGLRYGSNTSSVRMNSESVAANEDLSDNPLQPELDYLEEDEGPNFFENVLISLDTTLQKIVQSSYIGTNITMMVWSITYHNWLGFVLMLWAIVLWIFPNQRRSMMRSSPFIVCYAFFLLVSQYVYCMDLTEQELPSVVQGVNLAQIGFAKILQLPFNTLFMKSAFTLMFLATMRQYMRERNAERQSSVFCDFVAPLHLVMGTSAVKTEQEITGTKLMKQLAEILQTILIKFWIWVVVMMLFVSGIAGDRITGFRIVYMALFLFFILTFQLSYQLWRKIMYAFWMTVIIISVIILVLVYTYQFDNFSNYWNEYLKIPKKLQLDIGLEVFQTKELFVRLLTPTFFVVITVIQMQYFHKDFLKMTDLRTGRENVSDTNSDWRNSRNLPGPSNRPTVPTHPSSPTNFSSSKINSLHKVSTLHLHKAYLKLSKFLLDVWDLCFLLLDFHMTKMITLIIMLVCVHDVCAIHLSLVTLLVFSFCFGRFLRKYAIFLISCIVSTMILFRMVYQMEYIDHNRWNVQCTNSSTPDITPVLNTASWLGFNKTDSTHSLNNILTWYLLFIFLVTLRSIIFLRQMHQRVGRNEPISRPNIMFAEIDRKKADDNLLSCAKYLLNYGFYKFGIEITLIAIVILIGIRMDMYAIFYSLWLFATFNRSRESLGRIWKFFLLFLIAVIPFQYAMAVGLPPFLCFDLPWTNHSASNKKLLEWLRDWAFLSDPIHPPNAKRIICDFVVLLLAARQSIVFRIEYQCRLANIYYPGGSNCSIIHLAETRDFVNPVPDFVAYITSWLDILKKVVLMRFLWLALASVFLAGANRTNVFSIGYLIGSFWFLWQGSDFYLKPISVMIKSWNILLGYNVTVIFLKCLLQILSCTLVLSNYPSACSIFQMLGVGCPLVEQGIDSSSIHDSHLVSDAIIGSNSENQCFDLNDVGLRWDVICFVFVIFQRRLFNSYNLFHIIEDTKAMTILASRGAELIEELRQKQIVQMSEHERMVLEKIKRKMDRIKRNQQKIQGPKYQDPMNHYIAIRSGDYYMFDIADEEDDDDLELSLASAEDSLDQTVHKSHGLTVFEFIDTTLKSDMDAPLKARYGIEDKPKKPKRRLSEPILSSKQTYLFHTYSFTGERTARSDLLSSDIRATMPGTSRDSESPDFLHKDLEEPLNCFQKVYKILLFIWIFIESIILSATNCLNRFSRNYRYVSKVLKREKIILKEFTDFTKGSRRGSNQIWQPNYTFYALMEKAKTTMSEQKLKSLIEVSDLSLDNQPTLIRFLCALWFLVLSHSEILCYLIIFLNQIKSASIPSIPLPLMVFLWGTLTVPRPTISFWVVIIAYTEIIVLLKCIVQFDIWPWDQDSALELMGIEREQNYAAYDLMLLISVFFHRFMLKSLGLWKSTPKTTLVPECYYKKGDDKEISLISQDNEPSCSGLNVISMTTVRQRKGSKIKSSEDPKKQSQTQSSEQQEKKIFEFDLKKSGSRFSKRLSNQLGVRIVSRNYIMKKEFFARLLDHNFKVPTDVYAYMFLCDFINFLVIIFGFSDFGAQQSDGGVSSYLEENKVPIPFLGMLILQFILIIIDRAIFLRKNIVGKLWFQFFIVFGVHIGMFFLLPALTERKFNANLSPQLWYMMKCFYLILSAFQIRSGYPTRILGNYFCKGYNYINMVFYKCFMLVPFLFELRTIMDWMWTDTSMTIFDWLKMEDIFSHIYQLKCSRYVEKEYPQERGAKKSPLVKYFMGGIGLFVVIVIIWFPLLLFAFGNTVGEPNLPFAMNLKLEIGSYEALYKAKVDNFYIYGLSTSESYNEFKDKFKKIGREAVQFLSNYDYDDIGVIKMSQSSGSIWSISPPDRDKLIADLQSKRSVKLRLIYSLSRLSVTNSSEIVTGNKSIELPPMSSANANNTIRQDLIRIINGSSPNTNASILIQNIFPKFLKVTNRAKVSNVPQLVHYYVDENEKTYRNLTIGLKSLNQFNWWQIKETCTDPYYEKFLKNIPYSDCDSLVFYTFNDKRFPPSLSVISGGGIISLYTTLVFVASRVIRGFFSDICFKIMFEDMPNVDRILQLCLDIYLVRESRELALEEDLFAKLIFLFRSPETLIKWSRMKENTARRKIRNDSTSRDDDNNSTYNLTSAVSD